MTDTDIRSICQDLNQRDLLELVQRLAKLHHVSVHEVLDDVKFRPAVLARHALWYELREVHGWRNIDIARVLRRNKDTIKDGIRYHRELAKCSPADGKRGAA